MKLRRSLVILLVWALCLGLVPVYGSAKADDFDYNRAKLLGYILQRYLNSHNFSHKKLDDGLSRNAFALYLKQLDSQKRFLLKEDVDKLKAYSDKIDDEINTAKIDLPEISSGILSRRIVHIRTMVNDILSGDFDFSKDESFETDPEKLDFGKTEAELKERWRKTIKYQVLAKYLNLLEDKDAKTGAEAGAKIQEDLLKTAREKIRKGYEESFARMMNEKKSEMYDRLFSAVARAFDPHTNYMPPVSKEDFDISMRGSLEGIGALLRDEDGYVKVESVMPGGPAARQGQLLAGDTILKVGEGKNEPVEIVDMALKDAVRLIRGKKGSEVRLTIKRKGSAQLVIPIVRGLIQLEDTFAKGTALKEEKGGRTFGYLKLPSFYRDFQGYKSNGNGRSSTEDMKKELKKLEAENINGLILDLRNNGGGALEDAVNIAGLFLKEGPVVQIKSASGGINVLSDTNPATIYDGPLVVLVNEFSASASEILAGALQDYGRAVIIGGAHTHGKGTVQMVVDLDSGLSYEGMDKYKPFGALLLTIQKFYRVNGGSTQYRGVVPDIILPDPLKGLKTGEQYLEYALPWDTVAPVPYQKWQLSHIDIAALKAKSSARVQSNPEFRNLVKEGEKISEKQENTLQSLNITVVRKEREEVQKLWGKEGKMSHGYVKTDAKKPSDASLTAVEKDKLWDDELRKDPYVRESMAVLTDMLIAKPGPSMN